MKRHCDNCGKIYSPDPRNIKRGWGLCCTKSCAAKKREAIKRGKFKVKITIDRKINKLLEL